MTRLLRTSLLLATALAFAGLGAAGCGGASPSGGFPSIGGGDEPLSSVDQTFTGYEPVSLEGERFEPRALGRPSLSRFYPRRPVAIEAQRDRVARAGRSPADVQVLSSLLFDRAEELEKDPGAGDGEAAEEAKALREEAVSLLREERERAGDATSLETLEMLAAAEAWAGDPARAAAAYEALVAGFPEEERAPGWKTWLAYHYLLMGRDADASSVADDLGAHSKDPSAAYVRAWTLFRRGEEEAARRAMIEAARSWRGVLGRELVAELVMMVARTATPPEEADELLAELAGDRVSARYAWLYELSDAYRAAGHYEWASQALDALIERVMAGRDLPPEDHVYFRYRQADYQFRLGRPDAAAARAIEAQRSLERCKDGRCPADLSERVQKRLEKLAVLFHTTYHTTLDDRYYRPARQLYDYLVSLGGAEAERARRGIANLEDARTRASRQGGQHDEKLMLDWLLARREAALACYERELRKDRTLRGKLELSLEVTSDGRVTGADSDPPAGAEGMAAVAACLVDRSRGWSFPGRAAPGKTLLSFPVVFSPPAS